MELNKIYHGDFTANTLPDKCANLIIADPPYFEVKGAFDFVWKDFKEYLQDVDKWARECARLLADNGTLFWYGDAKNIAYSQVILDEHLNLVNNLVWEKAEADGLFGSTGSEQLRSFPKSTERILMYSKETEMTDLEAIKLDMNNFIELREYFKQLQAFIGLSLKKINEKLGHRKAEHCFYHSSTQWDLPTDETYNQLIDAFGIDKWDGYKDILDLRLDYNYLREQYEIRRRHFNNFMKSTEVLKVRFTPSEFDHETVKPEKLARLLIETCSRPNDLVVVPFAGSGTECAMAAKEGRRFIGWDVEQKYVEMSNNRVTAILRQPTLFQEAWVANTNTRDVA